MSALAAWELSAMRYGRVRASRSAAAGAAKPYVDHLGGRRVLCEVLKRYVGRRLVLGPSKTKRP
jgi:hypothetical protein